MSEFPEVDLGFLFFAYKNSLNIKPYFINKDKVDTKIKIIGYKITNEDIDTEEDIGEKNYFTILLPIN